MSRRVRPHYTQAQLREAIAASLCWAETLRRVGLRDAGGNFRSVQRHARMWAIPTAHFDPAAARRRALLGASPAKPLEEVLVEGSSYKREHLKRRLYREGLKERRCEMCGQGEERNGARMALILDHVNGVPDDNRLENLRIVCANCAATLDTHCGRNKPFAVRRPCARCGEVFHPNAATQRYCSKACGIRHGGPPGPRPETRKVDRPPYDVLAAELAASNFSAVGRRYGVSDNAVRKWLRSYQKERDDEAA